jgi:hypothetical protein
MRRIPKQKNTARNVALIPEALMDFAEAMHDKETYNMVERQYAYNECTSRLTLAGVPTGPRSHFARYVREVNNHAASEWALAHLRSLIVERAVSNYRRGK